MAAGELAGAMLGCHGGRLSREGGRLASETERLASEGGSGTYTKKKVTWDAAWDHELKEAGVVTLHPTFHTLRSTPYTLHPAHYTLHSTPYTLHPTPYTLHPTYYISHHSPHTLHLTTNTLGGPRPSTLLNTDQYPKSI